MADDALLSTDARGVATLLLNRPDKHNVLSGEMCEQLTALAAQINSDPAIRVVVLTGAGRSFCAGGDLAWMQAQVSADRATRMAEARKIATMLGALNTLSKPLIGRVNGSAMGGGIGMMSVCDIAIAANTGKFGLTETRLGLIPATISPYVIARMGEARARRVFMSARVFEAAELVDLGLAARVVAPQDLDTAIEAEIAPYLVAAPGAVAAAKRLVRRLGPRIDDTLIDETIEMLADTWETDEAAQGIAAFLEKRPAPWSR